jgi:hypothetical protein
MKKIIIASILFCLAVICQAQWFIGSGLDYKFISEKDIIAFVPEKKTYSEFFFTPMVGYQKNKFAFGGNVILGIGAEKQMFQGNTLTRTKRGLWGVQSFVRYTFVEFGKFSVFANMGILLGMERINIYRGYNPVGGYFYGINLVPVFSYSLSKKINLKATLNFANLGWNVLHPQVVESSDFFTNRKTTANFGLGKNSGNITNINIATIGITYR